MIGKALHPAGLILIWLAFAFCIPWLRLSELVAIVLLLSLPLFLRHPAQYLKLLRRSRWLLLSLILAYAFATPGEALIPALGDYSPSRVGLLTGGLQALRLVALLAGLSLLLAMSPHDRILAGLYFLLRPFAWLGLDIDRIAARIWLTLHYAESPSPGEWRERLHAALQDREPEMRSVSLEIGRFSRLDYAMLFCAALVLVLMLVRGAA
ncbi:MAG TPA: hypothetical protein VMV75_07210 [Sulfuricella sp.]|nr:hypothetical protein [Sulfuricella sp.]